MPRTVIKEPVIEMRCDAVGCTKSITNHKGGFDWIPEDWVALIGTFTDHVGTTQFTLIYCPLHGMEFAETCALPRPALQAVARRLGVSGG